MEDLLARTAAMRTGRLVRLRPLRDADVPLLAAWNLDDDIGLMHMAETLWGSEAELRKLFTAWGVSGGEWAGLAIEALGVPDRTAVDGAASDEADPHRSDADGSDVDGSGALVGALAIRRRVPASHSGSFSIFLGPGRAGRGYGTDAARLAIRWAFDELGLHRLWLTVLPENVRAIRAYERAGFAVEARKREPLLIAGDWTDFVVMSILETDPR